MKLGKTIWRGVAALSIGGIMLLGVACSGDDKGGSGANLLTGNSGGKTLSECEYAVAFTSKLATLTGSMFSVSSLSAEANAAAAFDQMDKQLETIIKDMKALKSTKEVNEVNAGLVSAIESFRTQLPEAKKAAAAGDIAKMEAAIDNGMDDFSRQMDKMSKDHAKFSERLEKCVS